MSWDTIEQLLKLLFGNIGVGGTVGVCVAIYIGWLLHQEKEDHRQTRLAVKLDADKRIEIQEKYIEVLTRLTVLIESLQKRGG
jgi:hypothetical protein